jgi:Ser/Thr protein kinase RdoA (MazF antagonist)
MSFDGREGSRNQCFTGDHSKSTGICQLAHQRVFVASVHHQIHPVEVLTPGELDAVTDWIRTAYAASAASIASAATRTTGLALRVELQPFTMWLRVGGVVQRSVQLTELEGLIANELCTMRVPVATPVRRADGNFAGLLQFRGKALPTIAYVELRGNLVEKPSIGQAKALGVTLRKLHDAELGNVASKAPTVEPLVDIDARLSAAADWLTDAQLRELTELVGRSREELEEAQLPWSICHGDVRYANMFFTGDQPTLFDMEALGLGPRCYDLACLWRRCVLERGFLEALPQDWLWFRQAYEANAALEPQHWSLLPALACLRAFWTMTLPIDPNADWGEAYRSSADYWEAHMAQIRWFGAARKPGAWPV